MQTYDYIVVGAGSAGCPVARGLSDDPGSRVLLVEAGPPADRFWVRTPAGMARLYFHRELNWNFHTEPMALLQGRRMYWPRGRTLGGSSAINGMVFIRGHRSDFDSWRDLGNPGWGYAEVLPHFRQMEHFERGGDARYRGSGGPLWVSDPVFTEASSHDFIESAVRTGIAPTADMNAAVHDGVGFMQHTIRNGRRHSAWNAFIEPVQQRRNLHVRTGCMVQRVLFEGRQAVGIELIHKGRPERIHAAREVILSAGALLSPQLLMLSGIGPGAELQRNGIRVLHDLPGVGRNLQDHFYVHTGFQATPGSSYNARLGGWRKYLEGARYLLTRRGCLALGSSQVAAFVRSHPEQARADLQISFRPMSFNYSADGTVAVERQPGMGVSVYQLRPSASGHVALASPRAQDKPLLTPNFLTSEEDVRAVISGVRTIRRIMSTAPVAARVVAETVPGPEVRSDEDLYHWMQETGNSAHHQGGTCKMGRDALAVVDARLRVRGVQRLRVADASIMPHLTSGNTNAPTIMIGVKAAQMIAQDAVPRHPHTLASQHE